ncbi:MAG: tetratricopeptide repeat protein [Phaeodactylibacter sp.]|nr:tetratricopeptide repeat protein [Phaeodactylibacter sp.]
MVRNLGIMLPLAIALAAPFRSPAQPAGGCRLDEAFANELTRHIYENIIGSPGKGCPRVEIDDENNVAFYFREDNLIRLSKEAVRKLEQAYGCDAPAMLACILGHELRHMEAGHTHSHFGYYGVNERYKELELDADQYGLLYAWAAGYAQSLARFGSIFDVLGLVDQEGYPSKEKRRQSEGEIRKKAAAFADAFELGNFFLLLGGRQNCQTAGAIFADIGQELAFFREVHFSRGLAAFSRGLEEEGSAVIYPLEPAPAAFLRLRGQRGGQPGRGAPFFAEAEGHFSKAAELSPTYFEARLGMAGAALEKGAFEEAIRQMQGLQGLASSPERHQAVQLLEGILDLKLEGSDKKLARLQEAASTLPHYRQLAAANRGEKAEAVPEAPGLPEVDGINADRLYELRYWGQLGAGQLLAGGRLFIDTLPQSKVWAYRNGLSHFLFQESGRFQVRAPAPSASPGSLGRFRLLQCGEEETIVEMNEQGRVLRCIKVLRPGSNK